MPIWTVSTGQHDEERIEADLLTTEGGALVALSEEGLLLRAWAPGEGGAGGPARGGGGGRSARGGGSAPPRRASRNRTAVSGSGAPAAERALTPTGPQD